MELKLLIEYISERLNLNIIYDHRVDSKKVTIKAPKRITKDSLMGVLTSVLRMNSLILVDADEAGWKRVAADEDLMPYCTFVEPEKSMNEMTVVSQIVELKHINTQHAEQIIKPFLSKPGGNLIDIENLVTGSGAEPVYRFLQFRLPPARDDDASAPLYHAFSDPKPDTRPAARN